jgi:hypothetical protein
MRLTIPRKAAFYRQIWGNVFQQSASEPVLAHASPQRNSLRFATGAIRTETQISVVRVLFAGLASETSHSAWEFQCHLSKHADLRTTIGLLLPVVPVDSRYSESNRTWTVPRFLEVTLCQSYPVETVIEQDCPTRNRPALASTPSAPPGAVMAALTSTLGS